MSESIQQPDRLAQVELRNTFANIYQLTEQAYWPVDSCVRAMAWPSTKELESAVPKGDAALDDLKKIYAEVLELNHILFSGEER